MLNKFGKFNWDKNNEGTEPYHRIKSAYYNPRFSLKDIAEAFHTTIAALHNHFDKEKRNSIKDAFLLEVGRFDGDPVVREKPEVPVELLTEPVRPPKPKRRSKPTPTPTPQVEIEPTPVLKPLLIKPEELPVSKTVLEADEDSAIRVYNKSLNLMEDALVVASRKLQEMIVKDPGDVRVTDLKSIMTVLKDCNIATKDHKDNSVKTLNLAVLVNRARQQDLKLAKNNQKHLEDFIEEVDVNEEGGN